MKRTIYALFIVIVFCCCSNSPSGALVDIVNNDSRKDSLAIKLPIELPKESNITAYISEFRYVPLETNENSLFGDCRRMEIYKDKIYILDGIISPSVLIFDMDGRFLARAGSLGNGPGELASVKMMAIDPYHDYLILGDTMQNKLVFYSLNGDFRKEISWSVAGMSDLGVIGPNRLGFANGEAFNNPLPNEINKCRVIVTDTLGNIKGGMLQQKDLATFCVQRHCFFRCDSLTYFSPLFTSDIYCITDSSIVKKYKIDYHFTPNNLDPPENMNDFIGAAKYMDKKTALCGVFLEGKSFIAFQTSHDKRDLTTFYDKKTRKSITVNTHPYYTTDDSCLMAFNWITTVDDYFVGYVAASDLIYWNKLRNDEGKDCLFPDLFESLGEDDNFVLVFFKLKSIL